MEKQNEMEEIIGNYMTCRSFENRKQEQLGDAEYLKRLKKAAIIACMYALDGKAQNDVVTIFTDKEREIFISGMQRALHDILLLFRGSNAHLTAKYEEIINILESED